MTALFYFRPRTDTCGFFAAHYINVDADASEETEVTDTTVRAHPHAVAADLRAAQNSLPKHHWSVVLLLAFVIFCLFLLGVCEWARDNWASGARLIVLSILQTALTFELSRCNKYQESAHEALSTLRLHFPHS
jgi:hypothetical protein